MSGSVITLQHDQQYFTGSAASPLQGKALLRAVQNEIAAILSGAKSCSAFQVAPNGANPRPAAAVFDVGTAGTQTLTIGGVDFAVAFSTSATVTGALVVTAVNASSNALITKVVQASQLGSIVSVDETVAAGEAVWLLGVPLYAAASNPTNKVDVWIPVTDAVTSATNLAACINAHPVLSRYVKATISGGVSGDVYVMCLTAAFPTGPTAPPNTVRVTDGGSMNASTATLAAMGFVQVSSFRRDVSANHITVAAAGTGAAMLNTQTRLVGGAGGAVTSLLAYP